MSKAARTTTTGTKPPPLPQRDDAGRVSGARVVIRFAAYDGLMQLGSEAFSAPLPPPKSERPLALPRLSAGWYLISAAAGFSAAAVLLAFVFKPGLAPAHPRVALASMPAYTGAWTLVAGEHTTAMREVLEPIEPVTPVVAPAPEPEAHAQPSIDSEPAARPAVADAKVVASAAPAAEAPAETPMRSAAAPRPPHTNSSRHADRAAPVAQLSREQVIAAMKHVQPAVSACFHGTTGTVMADVTIIGRTGRVTTAQVSGQNGAIGSCIARAIRGASFPPFKAETLNIRYPFAH
jgi:hypothetical protein